MKTRRTFLAVAATATLGGVTAGSARTTAAETLRIGGRASGWVGQSPAAIDGVENPRLRLEPGQEYEIVWENLDGATHDLLILDENRNVVAETDDAGSEGTTRSLSVTASGDLAQYRCSYHPSTMRGVIAVGGESTQSPIPTPTPPEGTPSPMPTPTRTTAIPSPTPPEGTRTPMPTPVETTPIPGPDSTRTTSPPERMDTATDSPTTDAPMATDSPTSTPEPTPADGGDGGGLPGFGALAAVAALGAGIGTRLRRD